MSVLRTVLETLGLVALGQTAPADVLADPLGAVDPGQEGPRVRSLQRALAARGFGTLAVPNGVYDARTQHAVREFQREASTRVRAASNVVVDPATVTPYTGPVDGRADVDTLREIRTWRDNDWRSPTTYIVRRQNQSWVDVSFAQSSAWDNGTPPRGSAVDVQDARTGTTVQIGSTARLMQGGVGYWGVAFVGGDRMLESMTAVSGFERFPAATWEKRALLAVAANEGGGRWEVINTYDSAFMSAGIKQWTVGTADNMGELGATLALLPAGDLQRLLGVHGLSIEPVATDAAGVPRAHLRLDGRRLTAATKEELRAFRWVSRFLALCRDPAFQDVEWRSAVDRIRTVCRLRLQWGAGRTTVGQLLQTEEARAYALDLHVNSPGSVVSVLNLAIGFLRAPATLATIPADTIGTMARRWMPTWARQQTPVVALAGNTPAAQWANLTEAQRTAITTAVTARNTQLQQALVAANTAALNPDEHGVLLAMTPAQLAVMRSLFRWLRTTRTVMFDAEGRWQAIEQANGNVLPTTTFGALAQTAKAISEEIASISPQLGPHAGGTDVTIRCTRQDAVTGVRFDGRPGTNIRTTTVDGVTQVQVLTPASIRPSTASVPVDVQLVTATGIGAPQPAARFAYQ